MREASLTVLLPPFLGGVRLHTPKRPGSPGGLLLPPLGRSAHHHEFVVPAQPIQQPTTGRTLISFCLRCATITYGDTLQRQQSVRLVHSEAVPPAG